MSPRIFITALLSCLCVGVQTSVAAIDIKAESAALDATVRRFHQENEIRPVGMTMDDEFLRRVYLDITGTIPPHEAAVAFLRSRDPDKRARLIHDLLQSPGRTSHFYNYWASLLRVPARVRGMPGGVYAMWLKDAIADNMPYDELVYALVTASGNSSENGATGYYLRDQQMRLDTASATAQVFLGTQIGCAQCHDHKFDKWTQKDYYQFAAYMGMVGVDRPRKELRSIREEMKDATPEQQRRLQRYLRNLPVEVIDRPRAGLRYPDDYAYDNATPGDRVQPKVIFGEQPETRAGESEREAFGRWMTSPENPLFTKVIANRLWKKAIGVGLVEPVDDFNEQTEAIHPELLDQLVSLMTRVDYDMRLFLEVLYNTRTYQLAAEGTEVTPRSYQLQAAPLRRMTAEQIWDSILTLATGDANALDTLTSEDLEDTMTAMQAAAMDERADRVPRNRQRGGRTPRRASDIPPGLSSAEALTQFGRSDRETVSEGSTEPSIPQVLFLMNSEQTQRILTRPQSPLIRNALSYEQTKDRIRVLYLAILTREPSDAEVTAATQYLDRGQTEAVSGYQDLTWALLNTREFLFIR